MQETAYLEGKEDLLGQLRSIPAFQAFQETSLMKMLALSKIRKYESGELIMEEGAIDCWIYFLISGEVRVVKGGAEITVLKEYGEMFGEMSVIDGCSRSASVYAKTAVIALAMDGSVIDRVPEDQKPMFYAVLYRFFCEVLSDRLREVNTQLAKAQEELRGLRGD